MVAESLCESPVVCGRIAEPLKQAEPSSYPHALYSPPKTRHFLGYGRLWSIVALMRLVPLIDVATGRR